MEVINLSFAEESYDGNYEQDERLALTFPWVASNYKY